VQEVSWAVRSAGRAVKLEGRKEPVREGGKSRKGITELGEADEAGSDGHFKSWTARGEAK